MKSTQKTPPKPQKTISARKRSTSPFAKPTKIFVTGGTGFIGTKLVNALVEKGHTVHVLQRSTSNIDGLIHPRIKLVKGDITNPESLIAGMKGCTQVYHLAGYPRNWSKDVSVYTTVNVDATHSVFEAAKKNKVRRVLFVSSIVTLGPSHPGEVRNETMPRTTSHYYTEYERTKAIAEADAVRMAKEGFPVVIAIPTRVYGPGKLTEGNSVSLMIDQYDRGLIPIQLNHGVNVGNYVFVDDLVRGFMLALEQGKVGERYILGGENASLSRLFEIADEVSGKKHFQFNLPPRIAMVYAGVQQFAAEKFGIYPQITPPWIETFLQDWAYSCAKAQKELGYTVTPLKEGIRKTYEWILANRKT
jgi:farnesol dehydrogenase